MALRTIEQRPALKMEVPPPCTQTVLQVQLPLTRLNVLRVGAGDPVVMVPATISRLHDWVEMAQFVGQYFETYFFELPGHGHSTPFPEPYRSSLTAATIESLLDELGFDRIILFGFSFGGILTLKTLQRIQERIRAVVMLAPCTGPASLQLSQPQQQFFRMLATVLHQQRAQEIFLRLARHPVVGRAFVNLIMALGQMEGCENALSNKIRALTASTLDVLTYQIMEMGTVQFPQPERPFPQPCYFGMSVNDPMLRFDHVAGFLQDRFTDLTTIRFTHPYHQPPHRLSVDEYNREYGQLLQTIAAEYYQRGDW